MKKLFAGISATVLGLACLTSCNIIQAEYDVKAAAEWLDGVYVDQIVEGRSDYNVLNTIAYNGNTYNVEWSVETTNNAVVLVKGETETKVDVDEAALVETDYTLIATVSDPNGNKAEVKFYAAVQKAPSVVPTPIEAKPVEGTAYKLYAYNETSKTDLYFNGNIASKFYLGTVEAFDDEFCVDVYVEYVEGSDKLFNLYFNHKDNGKQYVGIKENWNSTKGYWSYNPYIENAPVSQFEYSEEYKTIITTVDACSVDKEDAEQDTTKVIFWGNDWEHTTIGGIEIEDLGAETNYVANLCTLESIAGVEAADKMAFEKDGLILNESYRGDSTVDLATFGKRFPDVKIAWSSTSELLTINDTKLTIGAVTENTEVKLTATLTLGELTETKEFTITVKPSIALPENPTDEQIVNAAYLLEGEETLEGYRLTGVITKVNTPYSEQYGNITVTIVIGDLTDKPIECYRLKGEEGETDVSVLKAGDTITVSGTLKNYNGKVEFDSGCRLKAYTAGEEIVVEYKQVTIPQALEEADGVDVQVSGTVASVDSAWNEGYGNMCVTIVDEDGNKLYIYRVSTKVALGDKITVKGTMATYNNARQIAQGGTATIDGHDSSYDYVEMTITEALAAEDGTNVIVTGTVSEIKTEYSSQFNNISVNITDEDGATLYLYRLSGNVEVGNVIKVKGSMATYSGNRQLTGGTYELISEGEPEHTCTQFTDATCQEPAKCTECGEPKDDVLGNHNYVDGTCSVCGTAEEHVCKTYTEATCKEPAKCTECGTPKDTVLADHNYVNGICSVCEEVDPDYYFEVTITGALAEADGVKVQVSGTVAAVNTAWSDTHNNITVTIVDAQGNELYVYRLATKVALGDIITIKGVMGTHNEARQIAAGATATIDGHDSSYDYVEMTIPQALAAEDNTNVIVTGTVVTIGTAYSSQYNNISVYIADEDGVQLYLYRLAGNVEVGKIITVKGSMATYSGARQLVGGTFEEVGTHACSKYTEATCKAAAACVVCGVAKDDVLADHNFVEGVCSVCGASESGEAPTVATLATFEFGANGTATHDDGSNNKLSGNKTFTEGSYSLTLTSPNNAYTPARDAKGNSCIKLGASSKAGGFSFTVPSNVTSVVIKIAKYKDKTSKITVNGASYTLTKNSNDGAYDEITVDTSTTKTVTLTTVSGGYRAMVNSIAFVGTAA